VRNTNRHQHSQAYQDGQHGHEGSGDAVCQPSLSEGRHNTLYFASDKVCAKGVHFVPPLDSPAVSPRKMNAFPRTKEKTPQPIFRYDVFVVGGSGQKCYTLYSLAGGVPYDITTFLLHNPGSLPQCYTRMTRRAYIFRLIPANDGNHL